MVRAGSSSSPQVGPMNGSPHGWSERYWRPSSSAILRELAPAQAAVEQGVGPLRHGRPPQRQVLVVGLVAVRAALEERAPVRRVADARRVVVDDLVVVPGDHEREARVGLAQVGGRLVERVQPAELVEGSAARLEM
jgi:hypothetical protein